MKAPITIAVLTLHVAIITAILVQPGCNSKDSGSLNPEITSPQTGSTVAQETPPAEGSEGLRAAPTRPTERIQGVTANDIPADSFNQNQQAGKLPAVTSVIPPKAAAEENADANYTVKAGDSLIKIAKENNSSVDAIASANGISKDASLKVGQKLIVPTVEASAAASSGPVLIAPSETQQASSDIYLVQKGDSLSKISLKYNTSVDKLMKLNSLSSTNIKVGQKLKVPLSGTAAVVEKSSAPKADASESKDTITHKIQSGETLGGIAKKYNTSVKSLTELNGIKDPRKIRVGQVLKVSAPAKSAEKPAAISKPATPTPEDVKADATPAPTVPAEAVNNTTTPAPASSAILDI